MTLTKEEIVALIEQGRIEPDRDPLGIMADLAADLEEEHPGATQRAQAEKLMHEAERIAADQPPDLWQRGVLLSLVGVGRALLANGEDAELFFASVLSREPEH